MGNGGSVACGERAHLGQLPELPGYIDGLVGDRPAAAVGGG